MVNFDNIKNNTSVFYKILYKNFAKDVYTNILAENYLTISDDRTEIYDNCIEIHIETFFEKLKYIFNFDGNVLIGIQLYDKAFNGYRTIPFLEHCFLIEACSKYFNIGDVHDDVHLMYQDAQNLVRIRHYKDYLKYHENTFIDVSVNFRVAMYDGPEELALKKCIDSLYDVSKNVIIRFLKTRELNEYIHADVMAFHEYSFFYDHCAPGSVVYKVLKP